MTATVVKPNKPMTLHEVDGQLWQLAAFLRRTQDVDDRGAAMIACDRLLDVRIALTRLEVPLG